MLPLLAKNVATNAPKNITKINTIIALSINPIYLKNIERINVTNDAAKKLSTLLKELNNINNPKKILNNIITPKIPSVKRLATLNISVT